MLPPAGRGQDSDAYCEVKQSGSDKCCNYLLISPFIPCSYLMELVNKTKVNLKMGLVQTAYANGASTEYIQGKLQVPVACTPTGVKHLHHKAQEFDVGVYFEANGHGTVVFSENAKRVIRATAQNTGWVWLATIQTFDSLSTNARHSFQVERGNREFCQDLSAGHRPHQ